MVKTNRIKPSSTMPKTAQEEARRLWENNARLRDELEAERDKGFWRRLFGE